MTLLEQGQVLYIGDTVRALDGKIGTVASHPMIDRNDGMETCIVDEVDGNRLYHNTTDLEIVTLEQVEEEFKAVPSYVEMQACAWSSELGLPIAGGFTDEEKAILSDLVVEDEVRSEWLFNVPLMEVQ